MRAERDIKAKDLSYWEFLSSSSGMYVIPTLQRPYTWGKPQVKELFDDIVESSGPYYIGSVVIIDRENRTVNRDQIIDGQQRVTTLSLFLICIQKFIKGKRGARDLEEDIGNMLFQLTLSGAGGESYEKTPRISFSNEVFNDVYKDVLFNNDVSEYRKNQFIDNSKYVTTLLKNYSPNRSLGDVRDLLQKIKDLQIVLIECKNPSAAFDLFESINGTGVTLASNDLIKNRIFQLAFENGKKTLEKAEGLWRRMEENLDSDSGKLKTFIRHQWLSSKGYTSHKKLFKDFETMLSGSKKGKNKAAEEYLLALVNDSLVYKNLLEAKTEDLSDLPRVKFEREEVQKSLDFLKYLRVDQVYSVLLYLYSNSSKNFKKDLNRLVSFQFLYKHIPGSPSAAEKEFANFAKGATSKNEMFVELKKMCVGHRGIFTENLLKKSRYKKGSSGDIQFILEKYLISEGVGTGFSEPTIEHVIDQSKKDSKNAERIHSLGNLTILEKSDNGSLQGKSFREKLEIYKKVWKVNQKIKKYQFEENPNKAIDKRGEEMAGAIYDLFLKTIDSGKWHKK